MTQQNYFLTSIGILLVSNRNSFRLLFDKIASVYFTRKINSNASIGNGQPREPARCQLQRRTFAPIVECRLFLSAAWANVVGSTSRLNSLCSASHVGCQRDAARGVCCSAPAHGVHSCRPRSLAAGRSSTNPPSGVVAVDRLGQTDGRTDTDGPRTVS